jgi:hypothetical protein
MSRQDPASVAQALIAAENAADVEAAVALFHEDAVVNDASGQLVGSAEIRVWQEGLRLGHFHADISNPRVDGEEATFDGSCSFDPFRQLGIETLTCTWTLVVEEGRVRTFNFWFSPEALARLAEAQPELAPG